MGVCGGYESQDSWVLPTGSRACWSVVMNGSDVDALLSFNNIGAPTSGNRQPSSLLLVPREASQCGSSPT